MVHVDILIREDQKVQLKQIGNNISELIRVAIDEFINKRTPKAVKSPSVKTQ